MRLIAILCAFNEYEKGNLRRCLCQLKKFVDHIVVYDDASTDQSYSLYQEFECNVIRGKKNDFRDELSHKRVLLNEAKKLGADWILVMDGDEVISKPGQEGGIRELCKIGDSVGINAWSLRYWNIWRSSTWHRNDYLSDGWFVRLFKVTDKVHFRSGYGLHEDLSPQNVGVPENADPDLASVLHYGYSSQYLIERRWEERTKHGVPKDIRIKGIQEGGMELFRIDKKHFPEELWVELDKKPTPIKYNVE